LSQERLVGERVVVKEIEIFGNFCYPIVGEEIGGARRMESCEQTVANIKQKSGGSLGNSDRRDG
jgi:hypothetical protein